MANIFKVFYPNQEIYSTLSYQEQKKTSNLVIGDVICTLMFIPTAVMQFLIHSSLSGILLVATLFVFIISLLSIKKGKLYTGSYLSTIGFIISCGTIAFALSTDLTIHVGYRIMAFCVTMGIINSMITLKPRQVIFFYLACQAMMAAVPFTILKPLMADNAKSIYEVLFITSLGFSMGSLILYYSIKLNNQIIKHGEQEHNESKKSLNKITDVLTQVKDSLNIGQKLNLASNTASDSSKKINDLYKVLINEMDELTTQTSNVKNASEEVNYNAGRIDEGIKVQNDSLSETSSAMTQISANLTNINGIAEKRRQGMEKVATLLNQNTSIIKDLVKEVEKLRESSQGIEAFVKTVDSIAAQTSLLAMNASIEAAHAGSKGQGFSVIALEIRKLSEETTRNAAKIADTVHENLSVVESTIQQISRFAKENEASSQEIYSSVNAMEEILRGISEIDSGTRDVMHSLHNVVEKAGENGKMITSVVNQISAQDSSITNITNSTEVLRERVNEIHDTLSDINGAITDIETSSKENEEVSARINALLE